eukprot:9498836-Pyramimonas_sp.AAC.1
MPGESGTSLPLEFLEALGVRGPPRRRRPASRASPAPAARTAPASPTPSCGGAPAAAPPHEG